MRSSAVEKSHRNASMNVTMARVVDGARGVKVSSLAHEGDLTHLASHQCEGGRFVASERERMGSFDAALAEWKKNADVRCYATTCTYRAELVGSYCWELNQACFPKAPLNRNASNLLDTPPFFVFLRALD
ncbi:hypothetical protein SRHO_G00029910 [Serrasalmus rhombeus]